MDDFIDTMVGFGFDLIVYFTHVGTPNCSYSECECECEIPSCDSIENCGQYMCLAGAFDGTLNTDYDLMRLVYSTYWNGGSFFYHLLLDPIPIRYEDKYTQVFFKLIDNSPDYETLLPNTMNFRVLENQAEVHYFTMEVY